MIILRIIPRPRHGHFRRDRLSLIPLLPNLPLQLLRRLQLLLIIREDRAAILRPRIHPLPIQRRGIVHPKQKLDQLPIRDLVRIEQHLQRLRVARVPATHLPVGRRGGGAARVADPRV